MSEIAQFATVILVVAAGFGLAILSTRLTDRLPVPAPALFLVAAAVASDVVPSLGRELTIRSVERVAVVALVIILVNGGMDIGWTRLRASARPVLALGVVGTFVTAALVAGLAKVVLGVDWVVAGVVGAALAPTDPAVVFSVLGRREIGGRSGTILEGEAGVNDPAGIALMLGMIELATHPHASPLVVVSDFAVEMAVGVAFGLAAAQLIVPGLRRLRLGGEGLHPVLVLALAAVLYGLASLVTGSGFLAVFILGLFLGDARLPHKAGIERFTGSLAGLAEIVVFVVLGLTISIGHLPARTWLEGLLLAVFLAAVARPLTVLVTLARASLDRRELAFIAWSGLKGAVPILLAAFAVLNGVDEARRIYGLVFVVVVCSVVGQGSLVPWVARRLEIPMREREPAPWQLSVGLSEEPEGAREVAVHSGSPADGRALRDLDLAEGEWVALVLRDGRPLAPRPGLELRPGDEVHVLAEQARAERR